MPLTPDAIFPAETVFAQFPSRRSVVHSTNGIVASTEPLACEAGQRVLKMGGNAAVSLAERKGACPAPTGVPVHQLTFIRTQRWRLVRPQTFI